MILEGGISYNQNWDKNGNIYYTDENGQVVDFKVNPFTKLANKAKATAINIGNWLNETNPNSEAYKQKVGTVLGLVTAPLGLGATLTGGIAKGLTPYVGRKIAQNMAQGIGSGVVGGAIGGGAEAGLNDRNIAIGGLQGATVGGLLGGLGGYGLGKVAQKLNTQTAWHGSPYKFDRFSNEAIGTGEGAQAHGYGHYAAKNKDVAQGYADRLSSNLYSNLSKIEDTPLKSLTDDTKTSLQIDGRDITEARLKSDLSYYKNKLQDMEIKGTYIPEVNQKYIQKIQEFQNDLNLLNNFDESILTSDKQLYKLSIPKDDVMLREGATLAEQPKLLNRLGINNTDNVEQEMANLLDYIKNNKSSLTSEELNNLRKQYSDLSYKKMLNDPQLKSEAYYEALTDSLGSEQLANEYLLDKGIKGISYNGGIDGEANVIFNPDDIDIIPYYDNPTSLKEKFINLLNR